MHDTYQRFLAITKIDAEQRIVSGIASTESVDGQGEIVTADAIKAALPDYLQFANIREMHTASAVGTALRAEMTSAGLELDCHVVDDTAWRKVQAGVYKGFSIGGKVRQSDMVKGDNGASHRRITALDLHEISLVDRPANPDAKITLFKAMEAGQMEGTDDLDTVVQKAVDAAIKKAASPVINNVTVSDIAKAADPAKAITLVQALRNDAESESDMDGAKILTEVISMLMTYANGDAQEDEPVDDAPPEGDAAIAMSAKAGNLRKAGRQLSGGKVSALKTSARSLLQLLADAGDADSAKALAAYGGTESAAPMDAAKMAAATGEAIAKAFAPTFTEITTLNKSLGERLDRLERQPVGGGPVLRSMEKALGTGNAKIENADPLTTEIALLTKMAGETSDPSARAVFNEQLARAQIKQAQAKGA